MAVYDWKTSKAVFEIFKTVLFNKGKITITALTEALHKRRSAVSDQLNCLVSAGLLKANKRGRTMYFSINKPHLLKRARNEDFKLVSGAAFLSTNFNETFSKVKNLSGRKRGGQVSVMGPEEHEKILTTASDISHYVNRLERENKLLKLKKQK